MNKPNVQISYFHLFVRIWLKLQNIMFQVLKPSPLSYESQGKRWVHSTPRPRGVEFTHRFPCVSYEATERGQVPMAAPVRRGTTPSFCGIFTVYSWRHRGDAVKTLPLLSIPPKLIPIPYLNSNPLPTLFTWALFLKKLFFKALFFIW